jgi:hypothetical protein
MAAPNNDELRPLLHDLRGALGAFVFRLALLDNQEMSGTARAHLEAMLVNVDRMVEALAEIASSFGHDGGKSTALAILHSRHTQQSLFAAADSRR